MDINQIYKTISYLVDKYQGTYLSPDEFNLVINMAQRQFLNYMTEDGSGHKDMQMGRKQGTLITAPVVESLSTFIKEVQVLPNIDGNTFNQPSDLYKTLSVRGPYSPISSIRRLSPSNWIEGVNDPIDTPTINDAVYFEKGNVYYTYPIGLPAILVSYIRNPIEMRWGNASTLVYDSSVYNAISNPNGSTQPEWTEKDLNDIIYRAIGIIGINLKDNDLRMAAQIVKQQGE